MDVIAKRKTVASADRGYVVPCMVQGKPHL